MKAFGLVRESASSPNSGAQRSQIEIYCKKMGIPLAEIVEIASSFDNQEICICQKLPIPRMVEGDVVVVSRLSRLGRSIGEISKMLDFLARKRIAVISAEKQPVKGRTAKTLLISGLSLILVWVSEMLQEYELLSSLYISLLS